MTEKPKEVKAFFDAGEYAEIQAAMKRDGFKTVRAFAYWLILAHARRAELRSKE